MGYEQGALLDVIDSDPFFESPAADKLPDGLLWDYLEGTVDVDYVELHAVESGEFLGGADGSPEAPCEKILFDSVEHITMSF